MLSLKVPPPLPWPHMMKLAKQKEDIGKGLEGNQHSPDQPSPDQPSLSQPSLGQPSPGQPSPGQPSTNDEEVQEGKTTEQVLSDTLNALRLPKIERDWKKCISTIEKVINIQPSQKEYNNPMVLRNIENYKDRLGKDLYECKVNLKRKEEEDKLLAQRKREKAQEEFEKRFESKYNLKPQGQQSYQQPQQPQQPQPQQPQQPYQQLQESQSQPQPSFGVDMDKEGTSDKDKESGDEKKEEEKGIFDTIKSYFVGDKEEEEEDEGEDVKKGLEEKEEMLDAINLYLKSQDPAMPQTMHLDDIKGIDNIIGNYKELIDNYETLDEKFQKYKETQKMKNFKDTSLLNEKGETIQNLSSVIKKLEKRLKEYKKNAEKKFIAQSELHTKELKDIEKEKDSENRKVHKYMQDILNERIDSANIVIEGLTDETDQNMKLRKSSVKPNKKRTQKKKPSEKKKEKKKVKKTKSKSKSKSKSKTKKGA